MGQRTSYTPGTFAWVDLTTTDPEAAKQFYAALFGWEADDMDAGDGYIYSIQTLDAKRVAAIAPQVDEQREAGAPPAWNHYVSVASADDTAARVQELGGTVAMPPFDVLDAGRQAVLQDPQGAWFMAWEPRQHIGAELVNAPGALAWNELATTDTAAARAFYQALLGWTTVEEEGLGGEYATIMVGDAYNGGIRQGESPDQPPYWLAYFGTADVEASVARVGELGGTALVPLIELPRGRFAVVQDPQGAVFALFAGEFQD